MPGWFGSRRAHDAAGRFRWAALMWLIAAASGPVSAAREPEGPYPYGKAEFKAGEIQDAVELLRIGDKYRDLCASAQADKSAFATVEHYGREAKNWYRAAVGREPSNAYASLSIGYIDLVLGRATTSRTARADYFATAMSRFREAREKRRGYARAYLYMAQVQALSERYAAAEENLRLILDSNIEDSQVHSWMGYVLLKMDRPTEARVHLARAIELDEPSPSAKWSRKHQQ